MFRSTTTSILPLYDPEVTEQSKSSNYNWKTLTKAGLVFVTTTGAFLVLKTTGSFSLISSWWKNSSPETDLDESSALANFDNPLTQTHIAPVSEESPLIAHQYAKREPSAVIKIGPEFQVNTYTTSNQEYPSVAGLSDGKFVATWMSGDQDGSGYGVYGQVFNADGSKYSTEFLVNTYTILSQWFPSVAGLSDGKFVVTWGGATKSVYSQMFNANGTKFLSEFQVNTYEMDPLVFPCISGLNNGKFVVTWRFFDMKPISLMSEMPDGEDIHSQMFNADGTKYLSEFRVNTYMTYNQRNPSVSGLSGGKFVVTWESDGQDGDGYGIYGQMYNADGTKYLSEFQVNTYTTNHQRYPSVAGLSDGKFVVTWESNGQDGDGYGIYGQMYNADGTKYLSEFQVNTFTTFWQMRPSVAELSDGKFVVTWQSGIGQDGDGDGVYGQMYNADGSKYSSEFQVNTHTTNDQEYPSVAGLSDGKFVVTWESDGQDGDSFGVYGQVFSANETFASSYFSSSQQIPESSSTVNSSAVTSTGSSSATVPISNIESSSSASSQSASSMKGSLSSSDTKSESQSKLSSFSSDIASQTSSSEGKSTSQTSSIASQFSSRQSDSLQSSVSTSNFFSSKKVSSPTSTTESSSPLERSESTSTQETLSSTSITKGESASSILVTSDQSQRLSRSETEGASSVGVIIGAIIGGVSVVLCIAGSGIGYLLYRRNRHKEYERELCDIVSDESEEPSPKKAMSAKKKSREDVHGESIKSEGGIFGVRDIQKIQHGDLKFEGDLGDGSFGRVYKATWQGSEVAVKVLKEGIADLPEFMGDFIREAATWSKLTHPNITRFFGICWTKPSPYIPYIVVEYVGGGSLASHLKKKDLTLVQRLGLGLDTVRGLRYLHECDPPIWHRDIKPDNVLVEYTWNQSNEQWLPRGKVTDFGTARQKILNRTEKVLTKGVGTPIYQAPEIITGSRDYSEKADIYSVGICLHEIYTQKEPYSDQPELSNQFKFFKAITEKKIRPTIPEEMPKSYATLIKQCWAEKPNKRPNAEGVEQQLKPIVDEEAQECTVNPL